MAQDTKMRPLHVLITMIAVVGFICNPLITVPTQAQAIHLPISYLTPLSPQSSKIIVSKTQGGYAIYSAKVAVSKPPAVGHIFLNLSANCSAGYPVIVEPTDYDFFRPGSIDFKVTLIVPPQAPPLQKGHITLFSILRTSWYSYEKNESATFSILRYYDMNVTVSQIKTQGGLRAIDITVRNDGNDKDSYFVIASDPTGIMNITQDRNKTRILGPDQSDTIEVLVRCPQDVLENGYKKDGWNIFIEVRSTSMKYDKAASNEPVSISAKVNFQPGPNIEFKVLNAALTLMGTLLLVAIFRMASPKKR